MDYSYTTSTPSNHTSNGTKEGLIQNIKEWMKTENEIITLQNQLKERKTKMKSLTTTLIDVMKENDLDNFDIKGGSLMYKKQKVKKPITASTLKASLHSFFQGSDKAEELAQFILENREEVIKETIQHKIQKNG